MLLAALALAASLAAADPPPPAAGASPPGAVQTPPKKPDRKNDPNRVICEDAPSVGSVIPHRICHTKAEWDARAEHDRQQIGAFQNDHANN